MIQALVFDFDGLLLDTETALIDAWVQLHEQAGLSCDRQVALDLVGKIDHSVDWWAAFGPDADREALDEKHFRSCLALLEKQPLLPGVEHCLAEAQRLGLHLAIASNSTHSWIDLHLPRYGLQKRFAAIRCRDDVARGKPEPDVYRAAVEALGVASENALAFEDSRVGLLAAKAAGLRCVAVPNQCTCHHDFSEADLIVPSLAKVSLRDLLRRWR